MPALEFGWPAAATVLGVLSIAVFRTPIAGLLNRTEKIKDWLVAPKQAAELPSTTSTTVEQQTSAEQLTRGFDNLLLVRHEASITAELENSGLTAQADRERVLVRHLAGAQIALHFERISGTIYGSQLRALRWLNSRTGGVHAAVLQPFYDDAVEHFSPLYTNYDFRGWLRYLTLFGLISESPASGATGPDDDPTGIEITVAGREYLKYLVDQGRVDPTVG